MSRCVDARVVLEYNPSLKRGREEVKRKSGCLWRELGVKFCEKLSFPKKKK